MSTQPDIVYTITDEAPRLATASLLPIVQHFAKAAGISVGTMDISLAARILAAFPDYLEPGQRVPDDLAMLGKLVHEPHANVIKLPNVSASIPEIQTAIAELQSQGYAVPDYPENPQTPEEERIQTIYLENIRGSAVNPVLREGNADRRPIPAAKENAKINPPKTVKWQPDSKTHVANMEGGDFYANEKSLTIDGENIGDARIEFVAEDGTVTVLLNRDLLPKDKKEELNLQDGEVIDATFMSVKALRSFIKEQMQDAKDQSILFSLHLKATMMKVSDSEMFGHVVEVFFEDVFDKHNALFKELGVDSRNGIGDVEQKFEARREQLINEFLGPFEDKEYLKRLQKKLFASEDAKTFVLAEGWEVTIAEIPEIILTPHQIGALAELEALRERQIEVKADIQAALEKGPDLYMVDSDQGITNLHAPKNVIIDASIPPIIRWGGQAKGPDGQEHDTKIVVPDTTYAVFHEEMANFSRETGGFDPATMGSVFNIGLMAQKAEEYGSHDKTFMAPGNGTMRVVGASGEVLHEHTVEKGDIWRACQAKDAPIKNWIELAVNRAHITGVPVVFWLDKKRPHDAQLIAKVNAHLQTLDTKGVEIHIMAPQDAARFTNKRAKAGLDTNAATGNVLRDHITDMYPILELGTSARMLSIVPLMNGGAVFETGAGGTAPDHIKQVVGEGHLRWDSLGEFAALVESFNTAAEHHKNPKAAVLGQTLNRATTRLLNEGKTPSRNVGELDNRGEHFYLALYWAEELARQQENAELRDYFIPLAQKLRTQETQIVDELNGAQGREVDLGGYYHHNPDKLDAAMRPSPTLNTALAV